MADLQDGDRPRKRTRTTVSSEQNTKPSSSSITGSNLFAPFRALGLVTNHVPFALQTRSYKGAAEGPRIHLVTCLGRTWAMWEGGKMTLLFVGSDAPDPITSLQIDGDYVWAASGTSVLKYRRGKCTVTLENPLGTPLSSICVIGSQLLALTEDGRHLLVWDTVEEEIQCTIKFSSDFAASMLVHPATYLNKVVVASVQGSMQLWNIRTQSCVHRFEGKRISDSLAIGNPVSITAIVQSPAIDILGIGLSSGEISIFDVKADDRMMRLYMEGGGVRALAFRQDGESILASASSTGHIALWDLNEGGRLIHVLKDAHDGSVSSLQWIPGQPVLVSSGGDNSVKQWVFDSPTSPPRLLKFRSGHHAPPHLIRYYGSDGKQILSAGRDRSLRCTSVVRDSRSYEFSQGASSKKSTLSVDELRLPAITSISHSPARRKDWDDILTSHSGHPFARSWSLQNKRTGKWSLGATDDAQGKSRKKLPTGSMQAVCVTACGNFGLGCTSAGFVYRWNMQSGIRRKRYDARHVASVSTSTNKEPRTVTGVAVDTLNRQVIASTLDGSIQFFDFISGDLLQTLQLPSNVVTIHLHRESDLLAAICDDLTIRVVDIELRRVVRELKGFRGRILDLAFTTDSRWLIASSLDSIIRTFDLPTGRLIDAFRTPTVATSLTFSPTGDFLATVHVDSVGVFLWANRAQYSDVSFRSFQEIDAAALSMPTIHGTVDDHVPDEIVALAIGAPPEIDTFGTPDQLADELVTLTLLPRSRWQTLLNLEVIQERNKPTEVPKAPEKAPFFLPTIPGIEHRFATEAADKRNDQTMSRITNSARSDSEFVKRLRDEDSIGPYDGFFNYLKPLSPAALDLEIRSVIALSDLELVLNAMSRRLASHRDFEAVQAVVNVVLRIHGEVLMANDELRPSLERLSELQRREGGRVVEMLDSTIGTLGFLRDVL